MRVLSSKGSTLPSLGSVDKPEKHDFFYKKCFIFLLFVGIQIFHHDILVDKLFI